MYGNIIKITLKPNLGDTVYTIDEDYKYISKDTVGFIGKDSFIIEECVDSTGKIDCDANYIYRYDQYGITWTYSLKEAKEIVKKHFPKNKIIQIENDWWMVDTDK